MAKDLRARTDIFLTVTAIGNLYAALVDTMRAAGMPNDLIHSFLDNLAQMNAMTSFGRVEGVLWDLIEIIRKTVPTND